MTPKNRLFSQIWDIDCWAGKESREFLWPTGKVKLQFGFIKCKSFYFHNSIHLIYSDWHNRKHHWEATLGVNVNFGINIMTRCWIWVINVKCCSQSFALLLLCSYCQLPHCLPQLFGPAKPIQYAQRRHKTTLIKFSCCQFCNSVNMHKRGLKYNSFNFPSVPNVSTLWLLFSRELWHCFCSQTFSSLSDVTCRWYLAQVQQRDLFARYWWKVRHLVCINSKNWNQMRVVSIGFTPWMCGGVGPCHTVCTW